MNAVTRKQQAQNLKDQIVAVHAIPLTKGYRVEIELADGERLVIRKKGLKAPAMVQLYRSAFANGNASGVYPAGFFGFSKKVSTWAGEHLKSYPVTVAQA